MFRTVLCRVLIAFSSLLFLASGSYSDTSTYSSTTVAPASILQTVPVQPELARGRGAVASNVSVPTAAAPVVQAPEDKVVKAKEIVVEMPPGRLSMELLRRSAYRYPDHDVAGRFVEMETELPPMFGDEQ